MVEEETDIDEERADHAGLPNQNEQRADLGVLQQERAEGKSDVRGHRHCDAPDLAARKAPASVPPYRGHDHPGGASLHKRLENCQRG